MSPSRLLVAGSAAAVAGLAIAYGLAVGFDREPGDPIAPIQLDSPVTPGVTATIAATGPTTSVPSAVVPPPTLGAATTVPRPVNVAPPSTPVTVPVTNPPTAPAPAPPVAPPLPPVDDDDVDDDGGDEAVQPERDDDEVADDDHDDDDDDDGDDT